MIRSVLSIALAYLLTIAGNPQPTSTGPATYEACAVRFGILPAFSVAGLVAGAERGRTLDIPMMVWLLKAQDRIRALASEARLIGPGHDPAVFERFPSAGAGIVSIT